MHRRIFLFLLALLALGLGPLSWAQDDDFFESDDAFIEESEDFDIPPPPNPDELGQDGQPAPFIPPPVRGGGLPIRNSNRPSGGPSFRPGANSNGGIQFQLTDPPLYWKKKQRPALPKSNVR